MTSRRTNDDSFIYSETLPFYVEKQVPITVSLKGCSPNVVFMQGYREAEGSNFVKNVTTKKVIIDRCIRIKNYQTHLMRTHKTKT